MKSSTHNSLGTYTGWFCTQLSAEERREVEVAQLDAIRQLQHHTSTNHPNATFLGLCMPEQDGALRRCKAISRINQRSILHSENFPYSQANESEPMNLCGHLRHDFNHLMNVLCSSIVDTIWKMQKFYRVFLATYGVFKILRQKILLCKSSSLP